MVANIRANASAPIFYMNEREAAAVGSIDDLRSNIDNSFFVRLIMVALPSIAEQLGNGVFQQFYISLNDRLSGWLLDRNAVLNNGSSGATHHAMFLKR